jgi:hypothetical protein
MASTMFPGQDSTRSRMLSTTTGLDTDPDIMARVWEGRMVLYLAGSCCLRGSDVLNAWRLMRSNLGQLKKELIRFTVLSVILYTVLFVELSQHITRPNLTRQVNDSSTHFDHNFLLLLGGWYVSTDLVPFICSIFTVNQDKIERWELPIRILTRSRNVGIVGQGTI